MSLVLSQSFQWLPRSTSIFLVRSATFFTILHRHSVTLISSTTRVYRHLPVTINTIQQHLEPFSNLPFISVTTIIYQHLPGTTFTILQWHSVTSRVFHQLPGILIVGDSYRKIVVDPDCDRKTLKVTKWQWKILNAGSSRKILVVEMMWLESVQCGWVFVIRRMISIKFLLWEGWSVLSFCFCLPYFLHSDIENI